MFRSRMGSVSIAVTATVVFAGLCAAQPTAAPAVPAGLEVPAGNVPFLKGAAVGTQNYVCLPSGNGLAWKFQGPQATLFVAFRWMNGEVRQQISTHFLSPNPVEADVARATWQSSLDSSSVWAKKIAESNDPAFVAPGAIPWFLLEKTGGAKGPAGGAFLAQTTYIQRIHTTGGSAPTTACTEAGAIQFVPYTADYLFYRKAE